MLQLLALAGLFMVVVDIWMPDLRDRSEASMDRVAALVSPPWLPGERLALVWLLGSSLALLVFAGVLFERVGVVWVLPAGLALAFLAFCAFVAFAFAFRVLNLLARGHAWGGIGLVLAAIDVLAG